MLCSTFSNFSPVKSGVDAGSGLLLIVFAPGQSRPGNIPFIIYTVVVLLFGSCFATRHHGVYG